MTKFLALNISVSEDGFMAGSNQSEESPIGENGKLLQSWSFATDSFQEKYGGSEGTVGVDNDFIKRGFTNIGATIMGRNMFGPIRGDWPDEKWRGWWGPKPVFDHPVFVLTHHSRQPIKMENGTTFNFITGGVEEAYDLALLATKDKNVRLGGGANSIQQYLEARLLDEIHIAQVPVKLGSGELLFTNKELQLRHYREVSLINSGLIIHKTFTKI